MPEGQDTHGGRPILTFVLIHGTFARGAEWTVSKSQESFRDQLQREFRDEYDVRFECVNWGERARLCRWRDNTLARRFNGAVRLVEYLKHCDEASPTSRRYLVAHSHGGSVVMYALKHPATLDKLSGIVCLSSPFLRYRNARFHRDVLFLSALVLLFVAIDRANLWLWLYTSLYTLVAGMLLLTQNFGHTTESHARLDAQRQRVLLPERKDVANAAGPIPFVAVRPHRDEVTILFWLAQNAGRAFRALWQFVNTVGRWAIYLFFAVRGIEWLIEEFRPATDLTALDNVMSMVDQQLMTPIMLIATGILLGMVGMRMFYAFDALPWVASLDLRAQILPWDDADAVAVDTFGFLAHTSVQMQAAAKIGEWIRHAHSVDPRNRVEPSKVKPTTPASS